MLCHLVDSVAHTNLTNIYYFNGTFLRFLTCVHNVSIVNIVSMELSFILVLIVCETTRTMSLALSVSFHVVFTSVWNGIMTQANFTQNFTRLALHWFHPGIDSFPVFILAAFPLLSRTGRAFLRLVLHAVLTWVALFFCWWACPELASSSKVWLTWSNSHPRPLMTALNAVSSHSYLIARL